MTKNVINLGLFCAVVGFWFLMSFNPISVHDFWLESILLLTSCFALAVTYKFFKFSSLSYCLIAIFLILHATGAHYTYSEVPFGFWIQDLLSSERNMFDRLVHFSFGLLLSFPIYEVLKRTSKVSGFWAFYIPIDIILATSGLFEIIEMLVAVNVSPELGAEYLGMQGDIWDAQKDMLCATVGSLITTVIMILTNLIRKGSK